MRKTVRPLTLSPFCGTPPTGVMKVVPVAAKVGSYPAGATIVGNGLIAFTSGSRAWFEFKLSDWDPNGDNNPPSWFWRFQIDAGGYRGVNADPSNPGVDLTSPVIACANSAPWVAASGESGARCELPTEACDAASANRAGNRTRPPLGARHRGRPLH